MFTAKLYACENEELTPPEEITIIGGDCLDDYIDMLDSYLYQHGYSLNTNDYYIMNVDAGENFCHFETGDSEKGLSLVYVIEEYE